MRNDIVQKPQRVGAFISDHFLWVVVFLCIGCLLLLIIGTEAKKKEEEEEEKLMIAFTAGHTDFELYLIAEDGEGEPQNITQVPNVRNGHPSWSPDGTKIVFDTNRDGMTNWEIYVMDVQEATDAFGLRDGQNQRNLTKNEAMDKEPAWSPNGRKISFSSKRDGNWEIYVMDADGQNQTRLTDDAAVDKQSCWSPDGKYIAFTSKRDGNWEIYVMDADGQNVVRLTNEPGIDGRPSWSPNGEQIAFTSNREGKSGICVMDADGQNPRVIVKIGVDPCWSPDGTRIAYCSSAAGGVATLYVADANGRNQVEISNMRAYNPAWQPPVKMPVESAGRLITSWGAIKSNY